jgi:hypothetical protein
MLFGRRDLVGLNSYCISQQDFCLTSLAQGSQSGGVLETHNPLSLSSFKGLLALANYIRSRL